jgi:hypothetical protein
MITLLAFFSMFFGGDGSDNVRPDFHPMDWVAISWDDGPNPFQ